jgi:hypothetical protein
MSAFVWFAPSAENPNARDGREDHKIADCKCSVGLFYFTSVLLLQSLCYQGSAIINFRSVYCKRAAGYEPIPMKFLHHKHAKCIVVVETKQLCKAETVIRFTMQSDISTCFICDSGIQQDRSGSEPSQAATTAEPTGSS